ncbi:hypothetical protein V501_09166, partial [Pseudogymnoascus sp. VKM F-4519 (FW-2642)]
MAHDFTDEALQGSTLRYAGRESGQLLLTTTRINNTVNSVRNDDACAYPLVLIGIIVYYRPIEEQHAHITHIKHHGI